MNMKYVLGLLVVILLITNAFFIYESYSNNQNISTFEINNKSIELPNGYSIVGNPNYAAIANDTNTIKIYKLNNSDVNSAINEYKQSFSENFTINVNDFDSKLTCKKTVATNNELTISKYWFELDNTVYQIQISGDNPKFDEIAKEMIDSIK